MTPDTEPQGRLPTIPVIAGLAFFALVAVMNRIWPKILVSLPMPVARALYLLHTFDRHLWIPRAGHQTVDDL